MDLFYYHDTKDSFMLVTNKLVVFASDASGANAMVIRFLETGQYLDFTIRCKGHEWKVHRAIICG